VIDFWNELAPSAGTVIGGFSADLPDPIEYEGRHRAGEVLDALEACATEWLLLVDYVEDLRQVCLAKGLSDTLVERLLEVFVQAATGGTEGDR